MKRSTAQKVIWWLAVLLVMAAIFVLSAQSSQESQALSGKTIRMVAAWLLPDFQMWTEGQQAQLVQEWQNIARKAAHFTIYAVLGALCSGALRQHNLPPRAQISLALVVAFLYAVSDEIHQMFVSGRGPLATDVLIDVGGAAVGITTLLLIYRLLGKSEN